MRAIPAILLAGSLAVPLLAANTGSAQNLNDIGRQLQDRLLGPNDRDEGARRDQDRDRRDAERRRNDEREREAYERGRRDSERRGDQEYRRPYRSDGAYRDNNAPRGNDNFR